MRSMTGFGSAAREGPGGSVSVELRSVNSRSLKVALRLPPALAGKDGDLEAVVRESVTRGSVQANVRVAASSAPARAPVDLALARAYAESLAELGRDLGIPGEPDLALVAGLPGVLPLDPWGGESAEALGETAVAALREALEGLRASRDAEGKALLRDFLARAARLERSLGRVRRRAPAVVREARARLLRRVRDALRESPAAGLRDAVAREVALLAERTDVSEEVTRLREHLRAFRAAARGDGEVGRRLDFLLQEMMREVNTLGAKAQDAAVSAAVVDMKVEVDRMKEQAANVE